MYQYQSLQSKRDYEKEKFGGTKKRINLYCDDVDKTARQRTEKVNYLNYTTTSGGSVII